MERDHFRCEGGGEEREREGGREREPCEVREDAESQTSDAIRGIKRASLTLKASKRR